MQSVLEQSAICLCNSIAEFVVSMCGGWDAGRTWEFGGGHDSCQHIPALIEDEGKSLYQP
jgi:hypothetical protein